MATQKKGLGMGLGALMSSNDLEGAGNKVHEIDINKIREVVSYQRKSYLPYIRF